MAPLQNLPSGNTACRQQGKRLVEVADQQKNDLLSELLVQSPLSQGLLREVWTGGMGHRTRRSSMFYWHGSAQRMDGEGTALCLYNHTLKIRTTSFI